MDTNGNGVVEWSEFMTFFGENQGALSKPKSSGRIANEAAVRQSTRFMQDDDLASTIQQKTEEKYFEIEKAFKLLDQDKSGMMAPDELRKVMDRFTLPMSDRQLDQFLAGFERDFEGCVSWRDVLADWGGTLAGYGAKGGVKNLRRTAKKDLKRRELYNTRMLGNKAYNRPNRPKSSSASVKVEKVIHPEKTRDNTKERIRNVSIRLAQKLESKWENVRGAFRFADTDKDNSLSRAELRVLFDRLDLVVNDADFELLMKELSDTTGNVSFESFGKHFSILASNQKGLSREIQDAKGGVDFYKGDVHGRQSNQSFHEESLGNTAGTRKVAQIPNVTAEQADKLLMDKMALQFGQVRKAFRHYDVDHSGSIGSEEFAKGLLNFNIKLNEVEMAKLLRKYDMDGSGSVDYKEFMERFGEVLQASSGFGFDAQIQASHGDMKGNDFRGQQKAGKSHGHISRREIFQSAEAGEVHLINKMMLKWGQVRQAFRHFDKDHNGLISEPEFREVLGGMGINMKPDQVQKLLSKFDIDASGGLDYNEFVGKFGKVMQPGEGQGKTQSGIMAGQNKHGSAEGWNDGAQHTRAKTPALERQLQKAAQIAGTLKLDLDKTRSNRLPSRGATRRATSRPSTAGDWVHSARSVRSLQAQCTRNIPFIAKSFETMDRQRSGTVKAEDFVIALVDAGVDVGSQMELANLAGRFSDGDGPTANVRYKEFVRSLDRGAMEMVQNNLA